MNWETIGWNGPVCTERVTIPGGYMVRVLESGGVVAQTVFVEEKALLGSANAAPQTLYQAARLARDWLFALEDVPRLDITALNLLDGVSVQEVRHALAIAMGEPRRRPLTTTSRNVPDLVAAIRRDAEDGYPVPTNAELLALCNVAETSWYPVSGGLPEVGDNVLRASAEVLVYWPGSEEMGIARHCVDRDTDASFWLLDNGLRHEVEAEDGIAPTHWAPLPDPPS